MQPASYEAAARWNEEEEEEAAVSSLITSWLAYVSTVYMIVYNNDDDDNNKYVCKYACACDRIYIRSGREFFLRNLTISISVVDNLY